MKLWIIKFKKWFWPFLFLLFTISLILFSKSNILATKNALQTWSSNVVPTLFPFFIATELLNHTMIPRIIGNLCSKVMRPIFNVPGIGAYALFMGIISGYPVGARIVTNFRMHHLCSKEEAERLLTFTNNSGPLFIIGTVGISLFYDTSIGILLLITHILASLTVGFIFRFWKKAKSKKRNIEQSFSSTVSFQTLGEILSQSILSSFHSVIVIGGFIVFFSIVLSILQQAHIFLFLQSLLTPFFHILHIDPSFIVPMHTGLLELTNGITAIAAIPSKNLAIPLILTAFLLGFGGISVTLQVLSIITKSDISIKPYILGKLLHGTLAAFYTYFIIHHFIYFSYLRI